MPSRAAPFWRSKRLDEMTEAEWESLCDGCGRCCLNKLEYADGTIEHTNVACRLLDGTTCRCTRYEERHRLVPDCVVLTSDNVDDLSWLPPSCAYRLVAEGKDLFWWHPLVSGDPETVHQAGISVRGRVISERRAGPLEQHVVRWPGELPRPRRPRQPQAPKTTSKR
jgi:uncharacterized protein